MELLENLARKVGPPSVLRVEVEKSRRAGQIGEDSGLFRVPRILGFDSEAGVLEFERIPRLTTFGTAVARGLAGCDELATRAGRALAWTHRSLALDDEMRIPLPDQWMGDARKSVFIHGDFTSNNVCIDESDMSLVVVDWSAAPLVDRYPTYGPPEFDVICFVRHLQMAAPSLRALSWPADELCDRFLRGYVDDYGEPLDASVWEEHRRQIDDFARQVVRDLVRSAPLLARHGKWLAQRLLYRAWRAYRPPEGTLSSSSP